MTTWINSQFPRPDFHRQVQRHYGLQDTGFPVAEVGSHCVTEDRQSSLTIHVCFLHETQFVRTNNFNMEEAGILEKITRSGFCYPALNQVEISEESRNF